MRLHRGEFERLNLRHRPRAEIAAQDLQRDGNATNRERNPQCPAMKMTLRFTQEKKRVHRRDRKSSRDIRGQRHVQRFVQARRIEHGCDRIDVRRLAIDHAKARRRIHPRVRGHDKNRGEGAIARHEHAADPMRERRQPIPTIKIKSEKNRFRKKGKTFERKRHPDDRAGVLHEAGPEEPKLECEDGAGDRADCEKDCRPARPAFA